MTGLLTFQEMFGFMDEARDINGAIQSGWAIMSYGTLVGQFPAAHKYLFGNATLVGIVDKLWDKNPMNMIQQVWIPSRFQLPKLMAQTARDAMKKYDLEESTGTRGDLLEYLRQKQAKDSTIMSDREVMNNILIFL